jgi:hypothetical protein
MTGKHQTFPTVFRFTPFFRIYCEKFTIVKLTLGHRKFSTVRNKKWRKSWCIAKKGIKNVNLQFLRSGDKFPAIQTIILKSKNCEKLRKIVKKAKNLWFFTLFIAFIAVFFDFLQIFSDIKGTSLV